MLCEGSGRLSGIALASSTSNGLPVREEAEVEIISSSFLSAVKRAVRYFLRGQSQQVLHGAQAASLVILLPFGRCEQNARCTFGSFMSSVRSSEAG